LYLNAFKLTNQLEIDKNKSNERICLFLCEKDHVWGAERADKGLGNLQAPRRNVQHRGARVPWDVVRVAGERRSAWEQPLTRLAALPVRCSQGAREGACGI
jgi:hypothetical protein